MSFTDRLVLWLHIGFAIFTIGPVTLAISSTPRYIRRREVPIVRYLTRITTIFTAGALAVLVFGIILGQLHDELGHPWLVISMTLFLVAIVLLVLIMRDQRRAIRALESAGTDAAHAVELAAAADAGETVAVTGTEADTPALAAAQTADPDSVRPPSGATAISVHVATVERGRIAAMGGIVNLIWLVILALMVWQP